MTLLIASVLLAAVATALVIQPVLLRRAALVRDVTPSSALDAEARKRVALSELKELEYDYLGGKLDEADYRELRARLSREALAAVRAAESAAARPAGGAGQGSGTASTPQEGAAAFAAPDGAAAAHACGFVNPPGSRFCAGCGARLG